MYVYDVDVGAFPPEPSTLGLVIAQTGYLNARGVREIILMVAAPLRQHCVNAPPLPKRGDHSFSFFADVRVFAGFFQVPQ